MKVHYFQHVPFEGLGSIEGWCVARGARVSVTRFYAGDALPDPDTVDFLIVMGGPMSVNDEGDLPWLKEEKAFIRAFIASEKPVLGVCLGAQLIASALGARVSLSKEKEIGWFPITGHSNPGGDTFIFPETLTVFHWHGETFDLPVGAQLLASSAACVNQAFQYGDRVIALQCHLETTPQSAQEIVEHCRGELDSARFVQSETEILAENPIQYAAIKRMMGEILEYLTHPLTQAL